MDGWMDVEYVLLGFARDHAVANLWCRESAHCGRLVATMFHHEGIEPHIHIASKTTVQNSTTLCQPEH